MNNVIFLAFRRMRPPLLVLVAAYAISVAGLMLVPGVDDEGNLWWFDFFHAFYFVSYMGSTIGFGEIPHEFSPAQRMWATAALYLTVIAWLYAIGKLLTLIQDPAFQRAVTEQRFSRHVWQLRTPFYLVCGYGETGSLLVRALSRRRIQSVVIDNDPERINVLLLENFGFDIPALCADALVVRHLAEAGLKHPHCIGVVALTDNDEVNLKIAVTSKLLNPSRQVISRAESRDAVANMASINTDHIINPFEIFANRLAIALHAPSVHLLYEWLGTLPRQPLKAPLSPPRGTWILCGFGRFGKVVQRYLEYEGIPSVIIERHPETAPKGAIMGLGTETVTLREAGIQKAVGIIAGMHRDANNLSVIMTARALNPNLYLVARQNVHNNNELFEAANLHWIMEGSRMIIRQILPLLTVPLLNRFLHSARHHREDWAQDLVEKIHEICGGVTPEVWSVEIEPEQTPALYEALAQGRCIRLQCLLRDPRDRNESLPCLVLMLVRKNKEILSPDGEEPLEIQDQLLCCAHHEFAGRMEWALQNANILNYLETGEERPEGYVWRWLSKRHG